MFLRPVLAVAGIVVLTAIVTPHRTDARFVLGLQGGPNLGSARYDDPMPVWDSQWDVGFSVGAFTEFGLQDRLSLVPEIRYVRIKNRVDFTPPFRGHFQLTHEYLSVPVALRLRVLENTLFLDAGPDVSVLLSAKSQGEVKHPEFEITTDLTRDITEVMERWTFALFGGITFNASSLGLPVEVRVRYAAGVTGAAKEKEWWSNWKTRELAAALAFKFEIP